MKPPGHFLALYPGHVVERKSGLVSTVCACMKNSRISWGIVYHRSRTVNFYYIAPKQVRLELIRQTWQVKARTLIKRSNLALCCNGKGDFTLKAEQLGVIKCIYNGKDILLWLPTGYGKSICYESLPFVFNYKHSDGHFSYLMHSHSSLERKPVLPVASAHI